MNSPQEVILTLGNVGDWPTFKRLLEDGKIVADNCRRLRYPHGAPVGKMVLVRVNQDGTLQYKESAAEWFGLNSPRARAFVWPE